MLDIVTLEEHRRLLTAMDMSTTWTIMVFMGMLFAAAGVGLFIPTALWLIDRRRLLQEITRLKPSLDLVALPSPTKLLRVDVEHRVQASLNHLIAHLEGSLNVECHKATACFKHCRKTLADNGYVEFIHVIATFELEPPSEKLTADDVIGSLQSSDFQSALAHRLLSDKTHVEVRETPEAKMRLCIIAEFELDV